MNFLSRDWMLKLLEQALCLNVDALRPKLQCNYLRMLDLLRQSQSPEAGQYLELWEGLGACVGLSDVALRAERRMERKLLNEGMFGCSWIKCPMYEQDLVDTFRCAGCRKAMYCDPSCQKR